MHPVPHDLPDRINELPIRRHTNSSRTEGRMLKRTFVGCLAVFLFASPADADVVELSTGQKLEGEVLKETGQTLFLDIGVDILRIPVAQVKKRSRSDEGAKLEAIVKKDAVYSVGKLPQRSVKELVVQYGAGVVLVQTPSGLGSGFIINDRGYCVTNYHVVAGGQRWRVTLHDNTVLEAKAVGGSARHSVPSTHPSMLSSSVWPLWPWVSP